MPAKTRPAALPDPRLVTCPDCQGTRRIEVMACPGFRRAVVDCPRCEASGQVTRLEADRVAEGRRRYEDRVARGVALRDEADRQGLTPMALADIEHAR